MYWISYAVVGEKKKYNAAGTGAEIGDFLLVL